MRYERRRHSSLSVSDRVAVRWTPRPDALRKQRTDLHQQVLPQSRRVRRQTSDPRTTPWSVPPSRRRSPSFPSTCLRLIRSRMSAVLTRPQRTGCDVWELALIPQLERYGELHVVTLITR